MKKSCLIWNICLIAAVLAGDALYYTFGGTWLKGLVSLGFVLVGAVNLFFAYKKEKALLPSSLWMVAGLFLSMVGDVVLNLTFIPGALIFAMGHVCYFIAQVGLLGFKRRDLIPTCLIFAGSAALILFAPFFDFGDLPMQFVCLLYALIISFMVGKAVANFLRRKALLFGIVLVGSLLFFFSDLMLVFAYFADISGPFSLLCLASYYPAQCLLGLSIAFASKE